MIWRVDDSGNPVQLLGFASGTLIRTRVMVTAGHFTAPTKALGARTTIVGYCTTSPPDERAAVDTWPWDGKRRIRASAVRKIVDETWGLWSMPS